MFDTVTVFDASDVRVPAEVRTEAAEYWYTFGLNGDDYVSFVATAEEDEWPAISQFLIHSGHNRVLLTFGG